MWILTPEERLREWKHFRERIGRLELQDACQETAHLWSYAPFVTRYLDSDRQHSVVSWPDPWVLLHENYYCDIAKSLGMLYTLYLSTHRPEDIELRICKDSFTQDYYNLVLVEQGKYVLNYEFNQVVNKEQLKSSLVTQYTYTAADLGLDQY